MKPLAMEKLGGAKCANCGATEALEINHIKGGGVKQRKLGNHPHGARLYFKIAKGKMPTKHLNVLCRICNALDHVIRKSPHLNGKWTVIWKGVQ